MSESKVQNIGRIYYVEPNNIYNDIPNGIQHPYEDYCISVDLTIRFGNRNSCGIWGNVNSTDTELTYGSDRGTINFIGGTNGYLTTNFTDIESVNPEVNTNECLGIESIHIAYTSWYVPQVSIRFVDVRGASLMSKQEQGYVDTLREDMKTGHSGNTRINGGSFFKALFSFPYPMFKLKVKGFYGREVTYNLSVEDFQGSFNADNGNFEVDVKFVGYMFGLYTDIPMNYLMIAPYFDDGCGRKYWEEQKENGRFKYYNALPFKTYPELVRDISQITVRPDVMNESGVNLDEKKRGIENRITALNTLKEYVDSFLRVPFDGGYSFGKIESTQKVYLFGISSKYEEISFYGKDEKRKYNAREEYDALLNKIRNYNDKYPENTISQDLRNFGITKPYQVEVKLNGKQGTFTDGLTTKYKFNDSEPLTIKEWVERKFNENAYTEKKKVYVYVPSYTDTVGIETWLFDLDEKIKDAKKQLDEVQGDIQKNMSTAISQALGFGVSVGNAFRMSFAHMETFINIFNEYLRRIHTKKGDGTRTLDTLGCSLANTDLSSKFRSDSNVPPFTMFYKEVENSSNGNSSTDEKSGKKKVPMWPGELPGNVNGLVEIEFVNKLIEAAKFYSSELETALNIAETAKQSPALETTDSQNYIPTTIYDLTHTKTVNPYSYLSGMTNGNQVWEGMMVTFFLRLFNWSSSSYNNYPNDSEALKAFGKIEGYNVFKANPTIPPSIRDFLKDRSSSNPDVIVNSMKDYITTDSNEDQRKLFDRGYGYKKHLAVKSGGNIAYDWATAMYFEQEDGKRVSRNREVPVFPIYNENPLIMNAASVSQSNERFIYLDDGNTYETFENKNNYKATFFLTASTAIGSDKLDYKYEYLNLINSTDKLSKEKSIYEGKIIPTLDVPEFVVGYGNNANQHDSENAVVIVSSTNFMTKHKDGVKLPKKREENDKDFYVQSPAFIKVQEGPNSFSYYQLYGHPFFYAQNEEPDVKKRNLAKAFLFAAGMPARPVKNGNSVVRPFVVALSQGAHMFKQKYEEENEQRLLVYPKDYYTFKLGSFASTSHGSEAYYGAEDETFFIVPKTVDIERIEAHPNGDLHKYDEYLIELFETWATEVFPSLNDIFELKLEGARDYDGFKSLVNSVDSYNRGNKTKNWTKFQTIFGGTGAYNSDFYDAKEVLYVKNSTAFDFQANKVSTLQESLFNDHICKFVMVFNTGNLRNNGKVVMRSEDLDAATKGFFEMLYDIYSAQLESDNQEPAPDTGIVYDPQQDTDLKLSTYMTLKTLYDRWLCMNREPDRWKLDAGPASEFSQFKFIDGFYRKIEKRLAVNFEQIGELAREMMASSNVTNDSTSAKYQGKSFYDFLSLICQKNQMMLLSLPMENEFTDPEGIKDMFDVKSYSKMDTRDTSCFVCLYSNKPSEHLEVEYDDEEYLYSSDGFNIANSRGEVLEADLKLMPQLTDVDVDGYRIPAFGVTYGKQNQSIFKKVTVNMQNPQVTEASIAATQFIASKGNEGGFKTALYGQDLYRIYSNYSYTCSVDMMGNAQIMPLTYFQLNNIPLFRGSYMIINIEHSITAGDMSTKFTGVRMSRYDTPLVSDKGIFTDPFVQTIGNALTATQNSGGRSNISEDEMKRLNSNIVPGQHKYTVTLHDLVYSNTQVEYNKAHPNDKLNNTPTTEHLKNLGELQKLLQHLEDAWTAHCAQHKGEDWAQYDGIYINCGYRSSEPNNAGTSVNNQVGSTAKPHTLGHAADIAACKYDTSKRNENDSRANYHNGAPTKNTKYTEQVLFPFLIGYMCANNIKWGQIIDEGNGNSSRWVHIAYCNDSGGQSCRIDRYRDGKYYRNESGCKGIVNK